ncbi:MAG TPA: alpha/beta hydrolase [Burkholderiaceae bacterium]|nr:alpha/beta hydrolase [Burkholderiaceae bacterium]
MPPQERTLRTEDGLELAGLALPAPGAPRAAVAMVHGLGEHHGRHEGVRQALHREGFAVAAADLRGFGRSPGARGHVDGWDDYRRDVAAIVGLARSLAEGRPVFLYGHSMGGLIVLDVALRRPEGLAGVVASAPALEPAGPRRPVLEALSRPLAAIAPGRAIELGLDPAGLSTDPAVVEAYRADPLVHGRVSMRWGAEILRTMAEVRAAAPRFPLPLLLLHGDDDPINAPAGSVAFHAACGHPDRTLRRYPGSRHEVHHDVGRRAFERDLVRWIGERAQRAETAAPGPRGRA